MKKLYLCIFILFIITLCSCENNRNKRINTSDLLPEWSLTTMPPHSYAEISGTYEESLGSEQNSMYDSIYESMYSESEPDTNHSQYLQTISAVTGIKIADVTSVADISEQESEIIPSEEFTISVINPSNEDFELLAASSDNASGESDMNESDTISVNSDTTNEEFIVTSIPSMDDYSDEWYFN